VRSVGERERGEREVVGMIFRDSEKDVLLD
jgi:hypothetical protein